MITPERFNEPEVEMSPEKTLKATEDAMMLDTFKLKPYTSEDEPDVEPHETFHDCMGDDDDEDNKKKGTSDNRVKMDKLWQGVKVYTDHGVRHMDLDAKQYARLLQQGRLDEQPSWAKQMDAQLIEGVSLLSCVSFQSGVATCARPNG